MKDDKPMDDGNSSGVTEPGLDGKSSPDGASENQEIAKVNQPSSTKPGATTNQPAPAQKDPVPANTQQEKAPSATVPSVNKTEPSSSLNSSSTTVLNPTAQVPASTSHTTPGASKSIDTAAAVGSQGKPDPPVINIDNEDGLDDLEGGMEEPPKSTDEISKSEPEFPDDEDDGEKDMEPGPEETGKVPDKPLKPKFESHSEIEVEEPVDTHFLFYFMAFVVLSVVGYVVYQRRGRIIALVIEGRSGPSTGRRRSNSARGERPTSGSYRKLVNNLEEAISSHSVKNSNVIY